MQITRFGNSSQQNEYLQARQTPEQSRNLHAELLAQWNGESQVLLNEIKEKALNNNPNPGIIG